MSDSNTDSNQFDQQAWLGQVQEDVIDPDRPIIDPHHHLWRWPGREYELNHLHRDTGSGHNVVKTVFVECGAEYLTEGPEHLKVLGETKYVSDQAKASEQSSGATIAGIVGKANLCLGDELDPVLAAHIELGEGRFKGIRHAGASADYPDALSIPGSAPRDLYQRDEFRRGVAKLGAMGLSYDTWHYHYQNADFAELARQVPDTVMVLDHFGTPLGVGPYANQRAEIFKQWKSDIKEIAACPNVVAKLGGRAMPDNGFGWDKNAKPPSSDEFVAAQREYYLHTIECFGPERCMFESNFPVDKLSLSYQVLYNGLKKMVADFSEDEKHAMFYGTAERVYRLS